MKSLVCLFILFVSSVSCGESAEPLSESQPLEEPVFTKEPLPTETEQTVLDYTSMLSVKGGFVITPSDIEMPISLEFWNNLGDIKWLGHVGVSTLIDTLRGSFFPAITGFVGLGLRYNFQPLTLSFKLDLYPAKKKTRIVGAIKSELLLGWESQNGKRVELGLGLFFPDFPFLGFHASFPLKKW